MTKKIVFLFFISIMCLGNAQTNQKVSIDELVSDYIKELQNQKIDTMCIYKSYCVGSIMTYDEPLIGTKETCIDYLTNEPVYVFCKEDGKTFLTKINYCWKFSKIEILKDDLWNLYFSHKVLIDIEEIKPFEYRPPTIDGKKIIRYISDVDHSCHKNFEILINNKKIEKDFDFYKLEEKNNSGININYQHNINLKSKLVIDILEKTTSEAEKNNTFKKIKSR
ncbi:hypothetical protein [Flavobacterium chungbukense]|uniref:Outer membrane lipoprotein-sorting protein n=1 Tax=Flavobacterium chungbukense TaxID=877464 RepID=A0ABP7YRU4_9FLAO|nr:hypothetical protein [Flavobacterium chungbukense]MCC4919636.1 hypothetical protein [Flavobacterium chungbukense]